MASLTTQKTQSDAFAELGWLQERSAEINAVAFLEAEGRSFERPETKHQVAPVLRPEVPGERTRQSPLPCKAISSTGHLLGMNYQATSEDKPVSQSFLCGLPALLVRPPAGKRFPSDLLTVLCLVANGIAVL